MWKNLGLWLIRGGKTWVAGSYAVQNNLAAGPYVGAPRRVRTGLREGLPLVLIRPLAPLGSYGVRRMISTRLFR